MDGPGGTKLSVKVRKVRNGYILKRLDGQYDQHSHFHREKGAEILERAIRDRVMPKKPYFRSALERVLTPEEIETFVVHKKPRYFNSQKGVRR